MRTVLAAVCLLLAGLTGSPAPAQGGDDLRVARIGVLAYRGTDRLAAHWSALRDYLDASVDGWRFELVPVTLLSAAKLTETGEIAFLATNPGHYVELDADHALSVIASRRKRLSDGSMASEFGAAVVVAADSAFEDLRDAAGRRVAAVGPDAFGGFQVAWNTFRTVGVDLFEDPARLDFLGFPMDRVVHRVLDGDADFGIVRSGLIEAMQAEGTLAPGAVRVLNRSASFHHGEAVSTELYPEWPFLATAATPGALRDATALALLRTGDPKVAARFGLRDVWSAPLSYASVRALVAEFRAQRAPQAPGRPLAGWPARALTALALLAIAGALALLYRRLATAGSARPEREGDDATPITPREREILALIAEGRSSKEIARALEISPKTVEYHRSNLLRKFDARTSSQLVAKLGKGIPEP